MAELSLVLSLALMGLLSLPHCALMCAAPCAALTGGRARAQLGFQLGRVLGYALAGALAATAMAALRDALALQALLRPLWTVLQAGLLVLGLWLLIGGRWPALLGRLASPAPSRQRAGLAGLLWFAWPCGLLQGALLTAALASSAAGGALAMAAFAIASGPALWAAPALLRRLVGQSLRHPRGEIVAVRLAGLLLAAAASWALGHGLWLRVAAFCGL